MNILIAADYATPNSGNFIGSLLDLAIRMRQNGNNIFFIFPQNRNTLSANNWVDWLRKEGFCVFLIDKNISIDDQLFF